MKKNIKFKNVLLSLHWYNPRVHDGVLRYSQEKNWLLHTDPNTPAILKNLSVDGAIISIGSDKEQLKLVESLEIPYVLLFERQNRFDAPNITPDQQMIGKMAADFFSLRKFKNFATFFSHPFKPKRHIQHRIDAFSDQVNKLNGNLFVSYREHDEEAATVKEENTRKINFFKAELKKLPRPLAVFIVQDNDATFFQIACLELGISIPEDVAIISVNNNPMICQYTPVPLSSIDPGWENIGYMAGGVLNRLMEGEKVSPEPKIVPPLGVVERLSSSIVAVDDKRVADAVSYIWQNLEIDPTVNDVCEAVGVERKTLSRLFSKHLKRGIKQEVQLARIRKIKTMLLESDMTSVQIAKKLNFTSEFYLYKIFKKYTGLTTKEFRQQAK